MALPKIADAFALFVDLERGLIRDAPVYKARRLSDLRGIYQDEAAYTAAMANGDVIVYETYETATSPKIGGLQFSIDTIYPGKVGREYNMTRGHAHEPTDCVELYLGIHGQGMVLIERPSGDFEALELKPGILLYVPENCLHRTVNTGDSTLTFLTVYPAHAQARYERMPQEGMKYLVVEGENGAPQLIVNPRRA